MRPAAQSDTPQRAPHARDRASSSIARRSPRGGEARARRTLLSCPIVAGSRQSRLAPCSVGAQHVASERAWQEERQSQHTNGPGDPERAGADADQMGLCCGEQHAPADGIGPGVGGEIKLVVPQKTGWGEASSTALPACSRKHISNTAQRQASTPRQATRIPPHDESATPRQPKQDRPDEIKNAPRLPSDHRMLKGCRTPPRGWSRSHAKARNNSRRKIARRPRRAPGSRLPPGSRAHRDTST